MELGYLKSKITLSDLILQIKMSNIQKQQELIDTYLE